jgi:hypothetical protein
VTRRFGLRSARLAAATVAASAALAGAGWSGAPAHSDPSNACPAAYPVSDITRDTAVTGLTVTHGRTPEEFTGTVQGVLTDGIAPDLDMIIIKVSNPTVDQAGIWEGMSGSPVYIGDKLVGAVAWGLAAGHSNIAGVTPAAEMQKMLSDGARPVEATTASRVAIPRAMASRLVSSGAATVSQVSSGMRQLPLPFTIGGVSNARLATLAPLYKLGRMTISPTSGSVSTPGSPGSTTPIVPGGNLVAGMSYGTITAAAIGTATMVCNDEVIGFGHPMNFTGTASMTMHNADAITIQDDPTGVGFKVANIDSPQGTIDQDHQSGIHGVMGPLPGEGLITSHAVAGGNDRTGVSHVVVPSIFSQIAFTNMLAMQDRVLDRTGSGAGTASWDLRGTADGVPFRLRRTDMYADPQDISTAVAVTLSDELAALEDNGIEDVQFDSLTTDSVLSQPYARWTITGAQVARHGRWIGLYDGTPLRPGRVNALKVYLASRQLGSRSLTLHVFVPPRARHHVGTLSLSGGDDQAASSDDFFDEGFDFGPAPAPTDVQDLLTRFRQAPHHNEIRATVQFPTVRYPGSVPHTGKATLDQVVGGGFTVHVRGVR